MHEAAQAQMRSTHTAEELQCRHKAKDKLPTCKGILCCQACCRSVCSRDLLLAKAWT